MYAKKRLTLIPLVLLVALACARKSPQVAPITAPPPSAAKAPNADSLARAEAARRDSLAREARLRAERERSAAEARALLLVPVHFEFNSAELAAETREILNRKLAVLKATSVLSLRLVGHADERGSDEFNIALGQRRAAAVRFYLVSYGLPDVRLQIASLGEESPICTDRTEACWWRNRRVEFEITDGGDPAVAR